MAGAGVQVTFTGDAIAAAILAGMNEEQKTQIISQALGALFAKEEHQGYGQKPKSMIEKAVEEAIKDVAHGLVSNAIREDKEIEERIRAAIKEAVSEGCTSPKAIEAIKNNIVRAVESVFGAGRY